MQLVQTNVEGLIPSIQSLSLSQIQISGQIEILEAELANLPEVIRIEKAIFDLKVQRKEAENKEIECRNQAKDMMMMNNLKEFTTLDGTVVSIQFTPGALVVEDGAEVPDEFYKIKTSRDLDKKALKEAFNEWKILDPRIYIQKDCKLNIKQK
jgi:hypothetical protein